MADLEMRPSGPPDLHAQLAGQAIRLTGGQLNNSINDRATARIDVDLTHLGPVDYSGPVSITMGPDKTPRFTGHVVTANTATDGITRMDAESGRDLVESRMGYVQTTAVEPVETIHLIMRLGGYTDDRLSLEGIEKVPLEAMMVEVPVAGLHVTHPFTLLDVEFRPWEAPNLFADAIAAHPTRWETPTAIARAYTVGTLMFNAEQAAQAKIRTAVDALLTTAIYGLSRDTDDKELPFQRDRLLARPAVLPLVGTQAVASQRRWVHELNDHLGPQALPLEDHYRQWAKVLSTSPPLAAANAMRALRDAADDSRRLDDRCHHLWSALEFYAANARPEKIVAKKSLKDAKYAVQNLNLPQKEAERLLYLLEGANQAPLMARIRHQVTTDGAPTSDAEWEHLASLRGTRNRTVHGGEGKPLTEDDLRWGLSIVARFILYHWARNDPSRPAPPTGG